MIRNNVFNLMNQAVQEAKSLWRIKNVYTSEAVGSDDIMQLWKKMEKAKEEHIAELQVIIAKYSAPSNVGK